MKRIRYVGILLVILSLFIAACSGGGNGGAPSESGGSPAPSASAPESGDALPEVQLTWYYGVAQVPPDQQLIEDEVNKILKSKINTTVKLKPIDFGSYTTKLNTASAAGEEFDLVWTANWAFNYDENVKKGAFLPLDKLIDAYAPETKKAIPTFTWEATKHQGQIYAVPSYQTVTSRYGINVIKEYTDKYGLDVGKVKRYEDLEPFFEQIKQNEPGIVPFMLVGPLTKFHPFLYGYDDYGVKIGDESYRTNFMEETPEYKQFVELMHRWFEKGYINEDASTVKQIDSSYNGKFAASIEYSMKPGYEAEIKAKNGGREIVGIPFTDVTTTRTSNIATLTAISRTSKNPERAMMLLELVNTDRELYNLLSFGQEGKHYTKLSNNTVKINPNGGYTAPNWVFGNVFNGYLIEGQAPDTWEVTRKLNESAVVQPTFGFNFDDTPVKAENANVAAIRAEYEPLLFTGTVDPAEYLPEYIGKLKKAGADKVVAELQKQLDAWAAEKKKNG
ncbi:ABC transporter substrate-binding protein [Paenibacillus spongiae]|uniref:ABC transporter substrate-binding protein n=1 Tax=Paenibacillus spongiae TaxID=2909671 RepID=A0ABY5SAQ4_9BACL|nr:ABC transporter substrate-binding protein [Paenibacillus spongiae]UVI29383.1 ABC transporter substrate-binding protein [Paenibacillus spongiae]